MAPAGARHVAVAPGSPDLPVVPLERPAVALVPQAVHGGQLLGEHVLPLAERRERNPKLRVLLLVPAGTDPGLDPTTAHLVDRLDQLGEIAGDPERDRRDKGPEPDGGRLTRQAGEGRPRIGRVQPGLAGT